jgi:hypothetical protein
MPCEAAASSGWTAVSGAAVSGVFPGGAIRARRTEMAREGTEATLTGKKWGGGELECGVMWSGGALRGGGGEPYRRAVRPGSWLKRQGAARKDKDTARRGRGTTDCRLAPLTRARWAGGII